MTQAVGGRAARIEAQHDPYFVQHVRVTHKLSGVPRNELFARLCTGKSVLHVGYVDWPITDVSQNLHLALERVCARLDGVDPHIEAAQVLRPYVRGELYSTFEQVSAAYDYVLVPEVIEHVDDLRTFFAQLDRVEFTTAIITAPDAYSCGPRHFELVEGEEMLVEVVHPDHNCWFSPYTLRNLVTKYTTWSVMEPLYFVNGISVMLFANKHPSSADADARGHSE